jgi:hypothetical protein
MSDAREDERARARACGLGCGALDVVLKLWLTRGTAHDAGCARGVERRVRAACGSDAVTAARRQAPESRRPHGAAAPASVVWLCSPRTAGRRVGRPVLKRSIARSLLAHLLLRLRLRAAIRTDLEWKVIYVGSATSATYDQELDNVLVGPVPVGLNQFVLQVRVWSVCVFATGACAVPDWA